jgi:hypothetical protein
MVHHLSSLALKRLLVSLLGAALLAAAFSLAAVPPASAASHPLAGVSGCCAALYVHYAAAGNTAYDYTDLDNSITNGNGSTLVFVTPTWNPGGIWHGVFDTKNLGVWYNRFSQKWSIFNQDGSRMPTGAAFNVYALPAAFTDITARAHSGAFTHTATAANSVGDYTDISNVVTDNQPNEYLLVTANWSINDVYDNHPLGVWYHNGHWSIFHEDGTAIPAGASYNVYASSPGYQGIQFLQQATPANRTADYTLIDNPYLNTAPNALIFVTQEWRGVYNPVAVGVYYTPPTQRWTIFNENFTAIPTGALFTVL